ALASLRVKLEHVVQRLEAIGQPLRIVEPVNADRELSAVQARAQPGDFRPRRRLCGKLREGVRIDGDRKYAEPRCALRGHERIDRVAVMLEPQFTREVFREIGEVVLGLETDEI